MGQEVLKPVKMVINIIHILDSFVGQMLKVDRKTAGCVGYSSVTHQQCLEMSSSLNVFSCVNRFGATILLLLTT